MSEPKKIHEICCYTCVIPYNSMNCSSSVCFALRMFVCEQLFIWYNQEPCVQTTITSQVDCIRSCAALLKGYCGREWNGIVELVTE